ncbi:hypothetical protein K438DRAFT_1928635 [Mycena galopus ATCC 62051]|nr:hypothetical protein K438DRAFT_1928635 [Mycena galopus ATCC 62051]
MPWNPPDQEQQRLTVAYQELTQMNEDEKICSYDHLTSSWSEVPRPHRETSTGKKIKMGASGLIEHWDHSQFPIMCPHKRQNGLLYGPLNIRLAGKIDGKTADFFMANDHDCSFKVIIPPYRPKKIHHSFNDSHAEQQDDTLYSFLDKHGDNISCLSGVVLYSSDQQEQYGDNNNEQQATSSQDASSQPLPSSISRLVVAALSCPHPRYTGPRRTTTTRPSPVRPGPSQSPVKAYYNRRIADARKDADLNIMDYIHNIHASSLLAEDPTCHPAWDADAPPLILQVYDSRIYDNCRDATNNNLDFLYKPLGQVTRQLNSTLGVPACCSNHFSPYGYERHRINGRCTNHPDLIEIDECTELETEIRLRSFRADHPRPVNLETIGTPLGAALFEWNSRLGVPADVWLMSRRL